MRLAWRVGLLLLAMVAIVVFWVITPQPTLARPGLPAPLILLETMLGAGLMAAIWRYRPGA